MNETCKRMNTVNIEKQRKYLKDILKKDPLFFCTDCKAGLIRLTPVKLKIFESKNEIKVYPPS